MPDIKPGDLVRLKSGGPAMTVTKLADDDAKCMWFESNEFLRQETFPSVALVIYEGFDVGPAMKLTDPDPEPTVNVPQIQGEGEMGNVLARSLDAQKKAALQKLDEAKPLLRDD